MIGDDISRLMDGARKSAFSQDKRRTLMALGLKKHAGGHGGCEDVFRRYIQADDPHAVREVTRSEHGIVGQHQKLALVILQPLDKFRRSGDYGTSTYQNPVHVDQKVFCSFHGVIIQTNYAHFLFRVLDMDQLLQVERRIYAMSHYLHKIILLLTWIGAIQAWCEVTAIPASNEDEPGAASGARPYEMVWANRNTPEHAPLTDFEDLAGWSVLCRAGAEAQLYRSRQEPLFGDYAAKVVYSGKHAASNFLIQPPAPIPIPGSFTGVNLWVRGNNWGWVNPPATARVGIFAHVVDARAQEYRIDLGVVDFDYWSVMHRTCVTPQGTVRYEALGEGNDGRIDFPACFTGIEICGCSSKEPARLYFDALQFYTIEYAPLTFKPIPENLPWPTTPDTILPACKRPVTVETREENGQWVWTSKDDAETIRYVYAPADGTLGDLRVEMNEKAFQPCWQGGILFAMNGKTLRPGAEGVTAQCLGVKMENGVCIAPWKIALGDASAEYEYRLEGKGKSMMISIAAAGTDATQLDIGLAKGLPKAKTVFFPYLTYGEDWPRVVCDPEGKPTFLLSVLDYYRSDASQLFGRPRLPVSDAVEYTGGALYLPKTDGQRNPLRERLFVTVSGDIQEVLPSIPNPDCDTGKTAREYLWRNIGQAFQNELLSRYKAYGIDKFIACHHEVGWRAGGESFTLRDRPAPDIGDGPLQEYSAFVRGLGYRFGTYTNYVDFAPVNANWSEDLICLDSDAEWQRAWPRTYALKPLFGAEKEAEYAPRIHERYGTTAQYCDVHTAYTPWGRTDYDARTPGAGMFRTQFNAFARLLWNESGAHEGPVFSEGNYQWFYAGIVDGNYATIVPYGRGSELDPLVDFDLLKMHPKMTDFGMGMPLMYFGEGGEWTQDESRLSPWFDRFHAATVAFGHIGYLTENWGFDGTLKSYYMLQALQQRYTQVPVSRIGYFNGTEVLDSSAAVASDAQKRRQVYVEYENGLRVWTNLSTNDSWNVTLNDRPYLLPPAAFLAYRENDVLAYSATVSGKRQDVVECADYLYLDTRDALLRTEKLVTRGAVAVKTEGDGTWWIIPATKCEAVSVALDWLHADSGSVFRAVGYDLGGQPLLETEVRLGADMVTVVVLNDPKVIKHRLILQPERVSKWTAALPRSSAVIGSTLQVPITIEDVGSCAETATPVHCRMVEANGDCEFLEAGMTTRMGTTNAVQAIVPVAIAEKTSPDSRVWAQWMMECAGPPMLAAHWIDVTAVPAFEVSLDVPQTPVRAGETIRLGADITSHLDASVNAVARLTLVGITGAPAEQTLLATPESKYRLEWPLNDFAMPSITSINLRVKAAGSIVEIERYLSVQPTKWIVSDLVHAPYTSGQCLRGSSELPYDHLRTGALVYATQANVGGEMLDALHTHPPYIGGVGYVFLKFDTVLPPGNPRLDFAMGFIEGSTTQDGCVFKVVIIDGDQETEVFSESYSVLESWAHRSVNLSPYAAKNVTIKLVTDVGLADSSHSDWALWGAPRVVMEDGVFSAQLLEKDPSAQHNPAPSPLIGLTPEDCKHIRRAWITLEGAGVEQGEFTSYLYVNGQNAGPLPALGGGADWKSGEVALGPAILRSLGLVNWLQVKNPGRDYMKIRSVCLGFELEDGRQGSTDVALGPYCSAADWLYAEGKSVKLGQDLPMIFLRMAP